MCGRQDSKDASTDGDADAARPGKHKATTLEVEEDKSAAPLREAALPVASRAVACALAQYALVDKEDKSVAVGRLIQVLQCLASSWALYAAAMENVPADASTVGAAEKPVTLDVYGGQLGKVRPRATLSCWVVGTCVAAVATHVSSLFHRVPPWCRCFRTWRHCGASLPTCARQRRARCTAPTASSCWSSQSSPTASLGALMLMYWPLCGRSWPLGLVRSLSC